MATNTGLFNFQSIMNQFYNWTPDEDDTAGQALKNTFLADNVQTVLNNQMAKDLAYSNAEIATGQMTDAAKLELANTSMIMNDEFNYGMQKMGAEYDYQSKFAVDEANRALNAAAQAGDIEQNQTKLEGDENRLNIAAQGREEINQIGAQGQVDKDNINTQGNVDISKIGAQGQVDQTNIYSQGNVDKANIVAQGGVDVNKIQEQGNVDKANIQAQGGVDVSKIQEQGKVDKSNIGAQGDVDVRKIDAQGYMDQALQKVKGQTDLDSIKGQGDQDVRKIGATGTEERKNMMQQTTEEGKTAARQSKYARGLAGMF